MMQNQKKPASPELLAADDALRRAAMNAKKLAEKLGTAYVIYQAADKYSMKNINDKPK